MALLLLVNVFGTAVLTTLLSCYYGNWKRQHAITTIIVAISWWLPALILTTLPADIASTYFMNCTLAKNASVGPEECRSPPFHAEPSVFLILWHSAYWSSQLLTWIIIPLMRSYTTAGDFTALAKLRYAIWDNVLYYASYLGIFISVLIYLLATKAVSFDLQSLKVLVITTGNTWGLVLVVIFLGYGLVEVPRSLWIAGSPNRSLHKAYLALSQRNMELIDEEDSLNQLVAEIDRLKEKLPLAHPLQPFLLIVYKQAHLSGPANHERRETAHNTSDTSGSISLRRLAQLHRQLKSTQHHRERAQALYDEAVRQALWKEDVQAFRSKRHRMSFAHGATDLAERWSIGSSKKSLPAWYWHAYLRPWSLRTAAVLLAGLSIVVVWSECTFFVRTPTLSLIALVLKVEAHVRDYFLLELSSFFALCYLSVAVFYTVFRLRIFNYYRLVGSHHTDENSLLFCGALLCRLTPSLCLNFLGLIHLDNHLPQTNWIQPQTVTSPSDQSTIAKVGEAFTSVSKLTVETAYTQFMGHLDMIPFIANGFNIYFPIMVLLLCLMTYFRFGSRLMHQLGVPQLLDTFDPEQPSEDSLIDDAIHDGRLLLRKERLNLSKMHDDLIDETGATTRSDRVKLLSAMEDEERLTSYSGTGAPTQSQSGGHLSEPVEYSEGDIERQFSLRTAPIRSSRW